ncbi:MAG: HypC/HybG/HupF family hydrogenase formation chaperone [Patescibacteria group bacterium]
MPFEIKKIVGNKAELEGGRRVSLDLVADPQVGDWVLVNADLAVSKVTKDEAQEINNYFKV